MAYSVLRLNLLILALTFGLGIKAGWADGFLFQLDNDKVVDTDRHYTNGVRIAYTPSSNQKTQLNTTGQSLARLTQFKDIKSLRTGWTLGQEMYTPEDVYANVPDPTDRPYAGWTYFGITMQNEYLNADRQSAGFWNSLDRQDTFELNFGVVGPSSKAAQTQNAIHRIINSPISKGWRSQIKDEPGILATRTLKFRTQPRHLTGPGWLTYNFIAHTSAHLGNVRTSLAGGMTALMGLNLKEDFGPTYGSFALPQNAPKQPSVALFLGVDGRGVVRDIFLDGNSFKNGPDVKKNPYVLEFRAGVSGHIPLKNSSIKAVHISFSMVNRTREFVAQDKSDRYGSLQASINF